MPQESPSSLAGVSVPENSSSVPDGALLPPLLDARDGSLDAFVVAYCERNSIRIDGDVFGIMFSRGDTFTGEEAVSLIEEGSRIYSLKGEALK